MIDTGDPVAPEASPHPEEAHAAHPHQAAQGHGDEEGEQNRLVEGNGLPGQAAQQEFDGVGLLEHLDLYQVARAPGGDWEVQKAWGPPKPLAARQSTAVTGWQGRQGLWVQPVRQASAEAADCGPACR